jgi:hypothetical protein
MESWAQPFPRTRMLRPSEDILRGSRGFRQRLTIRQQFANSGEGQARSVGVQSPKTLHPYAEGPSVVRSETEPPALDANALNLSRV